MNDKNVSNDDVRRVNREEDDLLVLDKENFHYYQRLTTRWAVDRVIFQREIYTIL